MQDHLTIKEASVWASDRLGKQVTSANITYLIQYGKVRKFSDNGMVKMRLVDLEKYYTDSYQSREQIWKSKLGDDLNWDLSFSQYKEAETTKHVHRLHPYKGKFIPQLVEYFLDQHTDSFKQQTFFNEGDIILDPFCGSGTTLVQANELNLHAIGIDVSVFNAFISNTKVTNYDLQKVVGEVHEITTQLQEFQKNNNNVSFEQHLVKQLNGFNTEFFPAPEFRYKVANREINEKLYGAEKEKIFLEQYQNLVNQYDIRLLQEEQNTFLDKWFLYIVRKEIDFVSAYIKSIKDEKIKNILRLILSRTIRSCRATTHADLGTLKAPVTTTYFCKKHGKICKPLFSILSWWQRYTQDTVKRLQYFTTLKTNSRQQCLVGDSRNIDITDVLTNQDQQLAQLIKNNKIAGIFSSPPYIGLINYHEQHAYAYDMFGFDRKDELEIGPLYKGQGIEARKSYTKAIADVLINCKKYLKNDYDIFLVANDKYRLYPQIAQLAKMKIVNEYKRPVLNRVEKGRAAYAEIIFHLKGN